MRRHLAPAGVWVVLAAHRLEQHVQRRDPHREAQRAVAVVRIDPVIAGPENQARRGQHAFVARAANLEKCLVLALELDFPVVETPRKIHRAVDAKKVLPRKALILAGVEFRTLWSVLEPACDFTSSGGTASPPSRTGYYYIGSATANEIIGKKTLKN